MESAPSRTSVAEPSDVAYVAVFAALIAALTLAPPIPVGAVGVPITLQTLGVALAGLCLGPWRGFAAAALYLAAGTAGLPIFAQGAAGLSAFAKPSAGYLLAFPFAALLTGFLAKAIVRRGLSKMTPVALAGAVICTRLLIIMPGGVLGLMIVLGISFPAGLAIDVVYWIGDLIKTVIAVFLAMAVHKAFPRLLRHR